MLSELTPDKPQGIAVLLAIQNFVAMFEDVFMRSLNLHVVAEQQSKKSLVPLYSKTLAFVLSGDCRKSTAVLSNICDALTTADKEREASELGLMAILFTEANSVNAVNVPTSAANQSGNGSQADVANTQLSTMPPSLSAAVSASHNLGEVSPFEYNESKMRETRKPEPEICDDMSTLLAGVPFSNSFKSIRSAADAIEKLENAAIEEISSPQPPGDAPPRTFDFSNQNRCHIIYVFPELLERISLLSTVRLARVWTTFFKHATPSVGSLNYNSCRPVAM